LRLQPNEARYRGFTYLKLGQFDKAIADYDAALNVNPQLRQFALRPRRVR